MRPKGRVDAINTVPVDRKEVGRQEMMITYHWDERGAMRCSFCGQDAMQCNLWNEPNRCVERAAYDVVCSTASGVWVGKR